MEAILVVITFYGAIALVLLSAASMIRRKHCPGALFGMASMASYVLFAWQWYSAFLHDHPGRTWFVLAYLDSLKDSRAFRMNMVFLGAGLVLALVNALGILWQWRQRKVSAPAVTD